ncbi:hemicentin-1-like [Sycon ciliatum]|uniref:hemicentin-1-like n=1 Tax=Sycon ciliatum TaxID=27933 RepID=UPI0031F655F2
MVHLSVCVQTKYSWIVLVTTLVVITTEVWCLTPRCFPKAHHPYTDEGRNGGLETFKWYTPGTLSNFYLRHNRVYSTYFEFNGSCTIKAIGISFTALGRCRVSLSSKSFDHNGWSNERSVRFSHSCKYGFRHNLHFSVQSSHGLQIKFTVRSPPSRPLSQCAFKLNEAREPYIALQVQEDHDECSASNHLCYGYYNPSYCTNTWGSFSCTRTCPRGYRHGYGHICNDINECALSSTPCYGYIRRDNEPDCVNTPGAYQCICRQGYEIVKKGDRFQCQDIDECSLTPHHCVAYSAQDPRRCVNSMGSYSCNCVEGY